MITTKRSKRGFLYGKFHDAKNVLCSIQKSSSVLPKIWLGPDKVSPTLNGLPVQPCIDLKIDDDRVLLSARMHLTQKQVQIVIEYLDLFIKEIKFSRKQFDDSCPYGSTCSMQLSDNEFELGTEHVDAQYFDNGWKPLSFPEGTKFTKHMFLNRELAENLAEQLKHFVEFDDLK